MWRHDADVYTKNGTLRPRPMTQMPHDITGEYGEGVSFRPKLSHALDPLS